MTAGSRFTSGFRSIWIMTTYYGGILWFCSSNVKRYSAQAFSILPETTTTTTSTTARRWTSARTSSFTVLGASSPNKTTQYTIEEPGVDPDVLEATVTKHYQNLGRFLSSKPIAAHTQQAFEMLKQELQSTKSPNTKRIILDSGCGTGRSTRHLSTIYPDHFIVGVDRSLARLSQNVSFRQSPAGKNKPATSSDIIVSRSEEDDDDENNEEEERTVRRNGNVIMVRAELADLWRLWLADPSLANAVDKHFMLYPNPFPKKRRFQSRWYAHPAFPLLCQLGGEEIVVRSNWKAYLEDFEAAMKLLEQQSEFKGETYTTSEGVSELDPTNNKAWTNFEQKYFDAGEAVYSLILRRTR